MKQNAIEMVMVEKERAEFMVRDMKRNIPRCAFMSQCSEYRGQVQVLQFLGLIGNWEAEILNSDITTRENELAREERRKNLGTENENN